MHEPDEMNRWSIMDDTLRDHDRRLSCLLFQGSHHRIHCTTQESKIGVGDGPESKVDLLATKAKDSQGGTRHGLDDENSQTTTQSSDEEGSVVISTSDIIQRGISIDDSDEGNEEDAKVTGESEPLPKLPMDSKVDHFLAETKYGVPTKGILKMSDQPAPVRSSQRTKQSMMVAFSTVMVRIYSIKLGDNPSCSTGAPVCLSWNFTEEEPRPINTYELAARRRRKRRCLVLNPSQRFNILTEAGYSPDDLERADQERKRIQRQRTMTRLLLPFTKLEELWESARRKTKRRCSCSENAQQRPRIKEAPNDALFGQRTKRNKENGFMYRAMVTC